MTATDWLVMIVVLAGMVAYGLHKSRATRNLDGYFLSNRSLPWYLVLLSIMGTQASAITFLSGPGQAYADGMRFVQYYFGIPLAMVVICITFVPLFNRLKVYTAYEFLDRRFDRKTRTLTSLLFLLQRGVSTGVSIYAPSIIFSSLFGWDIFWTNLLMGGLLIIYTVSGGARAVAYTQTIQIIIIFIAMALAGYVLVASLPPGIGWVKALKLGGTLGRMNIITNGRTTHGFDWNDRYNIWSGLIGGFFLSLSYFGTDQSQVGRYLTAQNNRESRLGLLMNGLIKIPMQFFILMIGVLVFVFFQFRSAPLSFNNSLVHQVENSPYRASMQSLQHDFDSVNALKTRLIESTGDVQGRGDKTELRRLHAQSEEYRNRFRTLASTATGKIFSDTNDTNYIFLSYVKEYLPAGLKGLLIAVIFLASWGSIAAALNSLAASSVVDLHHQVSGPKSGEHSFGLSRWYTLGWGLFSIIIAQFSTRLGQSLIEVVNVLGSLFYGVILGIFLVAFYFKRIRGTAIFWSALFIEIFIILLFFNEKIPALKWLPDVGFLWLNAVGSLGVVALAAILQLIMGKKPVNTAAPENE